MRLRLQRTPENNYKADCPASGVLRRCLVTEAKQLTAALERKGGLYLNGLKQTDAEKHIVYVAPVGKDEGIAGRIT